jgi:conjugal transfer mating pair stabilization protein TraN
MTDFENAGTVQGSNDTNNDGWTEDGNCAGKIYIFSGQDLRCRSWDALYNLSGHACCGGYEDTLWGLVSCKDDEKLLAKKKDAQLCREIGEYCSKKIKLGFAKICVQKKKTYCCFNSKLAKTIVEQGNIQLGRNFGSAESPNCQGFQVQDFEKLDFSKMDFTDAFDLPSSSDINGIISGLKNLGNNISK